MKKSTYKILTFCIIGLSLLALLLGIIGGTLTYRQCDYYYKYDYNAPIPHTFEGSLAISGACILVLAIVFAALAVFSKNNKKHFFYCGSIAVCVISAILLFYGAFEYFSYDGAVYWDKTIHIDPTYFNLMLTSAIFSAIAGILSIVGLCIGNVVAKTEKTKTTSKNVQSATPVAANNNVSAEQSVTAPAAPVVQAPVSEPIRPAVQSAPQYVAVAPTPAKVPTLSLEDGLTQLGCFNDLYKAGILTQEEFSQQKRRVFEDMGIYLD